MTVDYRDFKPHPLYTGEREADKKAEAIIVNDGIGESPVKFPIRFHTQKPVDAQGVERDQTGEAAEHMRYAATLGLPTLTQRQLPRLGRAIIVGGAPSIKNHLDDIRELAKDKNNEIFAINWSHTWLINQGLPPHHCVFFEIDAEPDSVLKAAHKDTTYYICSHCHDKTFDMLKDHKRVLWHTPPNSKAEQEVGEELFKGSPLVGGGISTFTRTMTVALYLGFRHLDLFGCDSSYPEDGNTHVDGYETVMDPNSDALYVWAKDDKTGETRRFKTLGYLALQHEEFKEYCLINHASYSLRVHGDSLLRFTHSHMWPDQYEHV